jgi:predicted DNA-binding protein with PD1-like motif
MHAAAGREGDATVGCTRAGLETWLVGEVVLLEILGTDARREFDPASGFELLSLP